MTGGAFVVACGLAAVSTRQSDLLWVSVSPPALFVVAVIIEKALTSSGRLVLSTAEGTLITLANTAPWLLAGMVLCLAITFSRGLLKNVHALGREVRGESAGKPAPPRDGGTRQRSV